MIHRAIRYSCMAVVLAVAALGTAFTSGCAATGDGTRPEVRDALVRATVEYAVLRAAGDDVERANQIATLADHALSLAQADDETTALALDIAVRDRISQLDLAPEERVLVNTLADVVRSEIQARIEDRDIDADRLVVVIDALTWVRDTARVVAGRNDDVSDG